MILITDTNYQNAKKERIIDPEPDLEFLYQHIWSIESEPIQMTTLSLKVNAIESGI